MLAADRDLGLSLLEEGLVQSASTKVGMEDLFRGFRDSQPLVALVSQHVLRSLEPAATAKLRTVSAAAKDVVNEATEGDFHIRLGQLLAQRVQYNKRFKQQLVTVQEEHLRCLQWFLFNFLILLPILISLSVDFDMIPRWCSALPMVLAHSKCLWKSSFGFPPSSGSPTLRPLEVKLWQDVEKNLFSRAHRTFLSFWGAAVSAALFWVWMSVMLFPGFPWLPYLALLPFGALALVPMIRRYRETGQAYVSLRQAFVTLWIFVTAAMSWFFIFDAAEVLSYGDCFLYLCGMMGTFGGIVAILFWVVVLAFSTVALPVTFVVVNFMKGWHVSALCGLCAVCMQFTVISSGGLLERSQWPTWRFSIWLALAGVIACGRLAATLAVRSLVWQMVCKTKFGEFVRRSPVLRIFCENLVAHLRLQGAQSFVLPPLLPPTISADPLTPQIGRAHV